MQYQKSYYAMSVMLFIDLFVENMKSYRFILLWKESNKIDWHQIKTKISLRKISKKYTEYKEFLFSLMVKSMQSNFIDLKEVT